IWLYLYEGLQQLANVGAYWKLILGIVFVVLVTLFRHGVAGGVLDFAKRRRRSTVEVDEEADSESVAQLNIVAPIAQRPGAPVLEARGITKQYGGLTAVSDVDFSLSEGEMRGVIGPNGAGKSTF